MDRSADLPVVLLPIRPRYAFPIVRGHKKVEFRKTPFRTPPAYAVIYASSPVQRVVGYFSVSTIRVDSVENLWQKYGEVGCIEQRDFEDYYADSKTGVVLEIGEVVTLPDPVSLEALGLDSRPPQSFSYVSASVLDRMNSEGRERNETSCRQVGHPRAWTIGFACT